jgi:hypothetical protein
MAHPLTHLTHGIPTRRPFHPAKTASAGLVEQIAGVSDYQARGRGLSRGGEALAQGKDHAAQPGAGDRAELAGLIATRTGLRAVSYSQLASVRKGVPSIGKLTFIQRPRLALYQASGPP